MQIVTKATFIFAALAVSGCGGSGGLTGGSGAPLSYAPVYATSLSDTTLTSISGDGVSGVMSQADTELSSSSSRLRSVKIRLSGDGNTAFLTIDGATQSLPVTIKQPGGGQFGSVPSNVLQVVALNDSVTLMTYSGSSGASGFGAFGYVGVETPVAELPTGDATYSGFWGGQVYGASGVLSGFGVVNGNMSVILNFDTSDVTGTFDGSVNATDVGSFAGTISGDTAGNGALATMTVTSGDFTGSMPIAGKTFGFDGATFAGGFAGNLRANASGTNYAATGTFDLD